MLKQPDKSKLLDKTDWPLIAIFAIPFQRILTQQLLLGFIEQLLMLEAITEDNWYYFSLHRWNAENED